MAGFNGAGCRSRTRDLLITNLVLIPDSTRLSPEKSAKHAIGGEGLSAFQQSALPANDRGAFTEFDRPKWKDAKDFLRLLDDILDEAAPSPPSAS